MRGAGTTPWRVANVTPNRQTEKDAVAPLCSGFRGRKLKFGARAPIWHACGHLCLNEEGGANMFLLARILIAIALILLPVWVAAADPQDKGILTEGVHGPAAPGQP
jgi:hypothetical protein